MTLKGHIRNGQIVLDEPVNLADLADGTPVRVEVEPQPTTPPANPPRSVWDVLSKFAGTVDGPPDLAENHDHYAHGAPKRKPQ